MLISYKWLQEYFDEKLPQPKELAEALVLKALKVETVEEKGDDFIIDIEVTPNRRHDCLSHDGIAREVSAIFNFKLKEKKDFVLPVDFQTNFSVENTSPICLRYMACEVENVKIGESPKELKEKMESLGQKSIANIVDITNLVMFEIGQPMHAFDRDKLDGKTIYIRQAKHVEPMTTLDNKMLDLDETVAVIADAKDVLAVAGVKGGKKAEVDWETKNIVLEVANFKYADIRKTSKKIGVETDSSKRYENEITPHLTQKAMKRAIELIKQYASGPETKISNVIDDFKRSSNSYKVEISTKEANNILGLDLKDKDIEEIFDRLGFEYEKINPREKVLEITKAQIGKPYKYGASVVYDAPNTFDCSSLVAYAYVQAGIGYTNVRVTIDQLLFTQAIGETDLKPGDLVFSNTGEGKVFYETFEYLPGTKIESGVDHVGIYLGEDEILHATGSGESKVIIEKISESERFKNIVGYRRMPGVDEDRYVVTVPHERLDLRIKEDLAEEIGRIYGYEKVGNMRVEDIKSNPKISKEFFYVSEIRNKLILSGFSEISTYSLTKEGEIEVLKSMAEGKNMLRSNLTGGMEKSLVLNEYNADLLGLDRVLTFEIGKIFKKDGEKLMLCLGVKNKNIKKPKEDEIINKVLTDVFDELLDSKEIPQIKAGENVIEIDLSKILEKLPEQDASYNLLYKDETIVYKPFSVYPFIVRDIAVWVPGEQSQESQDNVLNIILSEAGELLVNHKLFDVFSKEGRTSYAFRLVFQSFDKTLSDVEINEIMARITEELNSQDGWEVR